MVQLRTPPGVLFLLTLEPDLHPRVVGKLIRDIVHRYIEVRSCSDLALMSREGLDNNILMLLSEEERQVWFATSGKAPGGHKRTRTDERTPQAADGSPPPKRKAARNPDA